MPSLHEFETAIEAVLQPEHPEVFLVRVKHKTGQNPQLHVQVDTDAGIGIDELAEMNRLLRERLEAEGLINDQYALEVSSPGVGEPLRLPRQLQGNIGRRLRVSHADGREVEGELEQAEGKRFVIHPLPPNGKKAKSAQAQAGEASQTLFWEEVSRIQVIPNI